mgnify:CR=1 FL=1
MTATTVCDLGLAIGASHFGDVVFKRSSLTNRDIWFDAIRLILEQYPHKLKVNCMKLHVIQKKLQDGIDLIFCFDPRTNNITGEFTEPVTGNQVLAYLRAQNLGKALQKAGINVDSYTYSVEGSEMRADVLVATEQPAKKAVAGRTVGVETGESTDMTGAGIIMSMVISIPDDMAWKSKNDSTKKKVIKKKAEDAIIALG